MNKREQEILDDWRRKHLGNFEPQAVLPYLYSDGLISKGDYQLLSTKVHLGLFIYPKNVAENSS